MFSSTVQARLGHLETLDDEEGGCIRFFRSNHLGNMGGELVYKDSLDTHVFSGFPDLSVDPLRYT